MILRHPQFADPQIVNHGFTTRQGGLSTGPFASLNLGYGVGDEDKIVKGNLEIFARQSGFEESQLRTLNQVHGKEVCVVEKSTSVSGASFDALITKERGVVLAVRTADCLPVLGFDPKNGVVAAIHAGWRGLWAGVLENVLEQLAKSYGTRPQDVCLVMGPAISACCFEVGPEVVNSFAQRNLKGEVFFRPKTAHKWLGNLREIAKTILVRTGVAAERIFSLSECTHCRADLFYSYRRDGQRSGRHLSYIELKG